MKKARPDPRLHALLDGEADAGACSPTERATLARYQAALVRLGRAPARGLSGQAPPDNAPAWRARSASRRQRLPRHPAGHASADQVEPFSW